MDDIICEPVVVAGRLVEASQVFHANVDGWIGEGFVGTEVGVFVSIVEYYGSESGLLIGIYGAERGCGERGYWCGRDGDAVGL